MQKDGGSCVQVSADATVYGVSSFFVNTAFHAKVANFSVFCIPYHVLYYIFGGINKVWLQFNLK
jgi:hypothetical protein